MVGDVVGEPGRRAVQRLLPRLQREHEIDFTIINCENAAAGAGATPAICDELLAAGADCLTSGNHIWKRREIYPYLEQSTRLLRPANYPEGTPGTGWAVYPAGERQVAVANLMGRIFLNAPECPFRAFDQIHARTRNITPVLFVDFHGEATSEKEALGWYADGRATAVIGTHTHVQTADEAVLPGGTGYLTDVGMTGPTGGVLGVDRAVVIQRFLTQLPAKFDVASGPAMMMAAVVEVDPERGRTEALFRLQEPFD